IDERHDRATFRQRRNRAPVETVAAIDQENIAVALPADLVDQGSKGGESAALLEHRALIFPEELVVRVELGVHVVGMQNREPLNGGVAARFDPVPELRPEPSRETDGTGGLEEFPARDRATGCQNETTRPTLNSFSGPKRYEAAQAPWRSFSLTS